MTDPPLTAYYDGLHVCVTGGAGFIGSHLVERLLSIGAHVTVIDDLSGSDYSHVAEMLDTHSTRYRFVHGSILEPAALAEAFAGHKTVGDANGAGVDIVFHEAALGSVPASLKEPARFHSVNAEGTLRVLKAARECSARRVVYAASSSAYGDQPTLPKVESQISEPLSPYAESKLAGERLMFVWARSYGLSTVSLRYFNVFGPRQRPDTPYAAVIAAFASALLEDRPPTIYGDGSQTRDFTYIDNVVQANLQAGASQRALVGEIINVGTGTRLSIRKLLSLMAEYLGVDAAPRFNSPREGDVLHSLADITRARTLLGYEPIVSVEEGLRKTVEWYRSQMERSGVDGPL
ncbi:MAG: SDR family NAD(P)-dependent oxidoreductase [Phycisphaerales bacterium]|nr:SDR family NAD(P)-dependent oxidoreductase [Phycisphaerales bacterium]